MQQKYGNARWAWSDLRLRSSRPAQNDLRKNPHKIRRFSAQKTKKHKGKRTFPDSRDPWPLASGLASAGRAKRKRFLSPISLIHFAQKARSQLFDAEVRAICVMCLLPVPTVLPIVQTEADVVLEATLGENQEKPGEYLVWENQVKPTDSRREKTRNTRSGHYK